MTDLRLDPVTNDIDIFGGLSLVTTYEDEARQRLNTALGIFLGEWFANTLDGLPYLQQFMTRNSKNQGLQTFIDNVLIDYIRSRSYIRDVTNFESNVNSERLYSYTFTVTLIAGGSFNLSPSPLEI